VILYVLVCCDYPFGFDGVGGQPTQHVLASINARTTERVLFAAQKPISVNHLALFLWESFLRNSLRLAQDGGFRFPTDTVTLSAEIQDLIRRILVVDLSQRLTIAQILAHPWCTAGAKPRLSGC